MPASEAEAVLQFLDDAAARNSPATVMPGPQTVDQDLEQLAAAVELLVPRPELR